MSFLLSLFISKFILNLRSLNLYSSVSLFPTLSSSNSCSLLPLFISLNYILIPPPCNDKLRIKNIKLLMRQILKERGRERERERQREREAGGEGKRATKSQRSKTRLLSLSFSLSHSLSLSLSLYFLLYLEFFLPNSQFLRSAHPYPLFSVYLIIPTLSFSNSCSLLFIISSPHLHFIIN